MPELPEVEIVKKSLIKKIKSRKIKAQKAAYAAQEDAWFHHQTDNFPAPLNDQN